MSFHTSRGAVQAVDGVSFSLNAGETLAIVGESGSGKTVTALTLLGLTRQPNAVHEGAVWYRGRNLLEANERELRRIRGAELSMIFQDPLTSLNPVQRIGAQIGEMLKLHATVSRKAIRAEVERLLSQVGIADPQRSADAYPHEFSGGMRQRAMIAMALACGPTILVADEPTTALDVTIQAQVLEVLKQLRDESGTAVILVTHDLGVVADFADRVAVMYAGRLVEVGPSDAIFGRPRHPYTWGLLGALPRLDRRAQERLLAIPGSPPAPGEVPTGCRFRGRCRHAHDRCASEPALESRGGQEGHVDACWLGELEKREHAQDATGQERLP